MPVNMLTNCLEIAGALLMIMAVAVLAWSISPALSLALAGGLLLALSWLITWRERRWHT